MLKPARHVVFNPPAAATLRQALEKAEQLGEVLCPLDNFSFGPIAATDADIRIRWVEEELRCTGWSEMADDTAAFREALASAPGPTTMWTSWRETRSCAGFLWFLSEIGDVPLSIIIADDLPLIDTERMISLRDQAVPFSMDDRTRHQARWRQLKSENAPLRVIEGERLASAPIDYFDVALLSHARPRWQKMARIVGGVLADFYDAGIYQAGDLVLGARLVSLAESGRLEWRGDLADMRGCELRIPAAER